MENDEKRLFDEETMVSINLTCYEFQDLIDFIEWSVEVMNRCVCKDISEDYLQLCLMNARNGEVKFVNLLSDRSRSIDRGMMVPQEDKRD